MGIGLDGLNRFYDAGADNKGVRHQGTHRRSRRLRDCEHVGRVMARNLISVVAVRLS